MKHEILITELCSPDEFLLSLYQQYPYDIEKKMVFSLLDKDTYPHPALLKFVAYFAQFPKYRMYAHEIDNSIASLCARMSQLFQDNKNTLHTYVFQFDATLQIVPYKMKSPYAHLCLSKIPFIATIHLHTLPILSMNCDYKEHPILKSQKFLFKDISIDADDYIAISIQINEKHGIIYLPKDQISIGIAISILYEVAPPTTEIDFLILYGLSSYEETLSYYFDETNQIYIGLIAGKTFFHFIYVMQMITKLYNAICIEKKDLPVHACMLQIGEKHKQQGILLMGDNHTGKSELCDCLRNFCEQHQIPCACVFENCGTLHYLDNEISATGIQIGACVSIYGLPKESIFQKLPICACLKGPKGITHLLFPFTAYKETKTFHKVNYLYFLNNHNKRKGCQKITQLEEAKRLFIQNNQIKTTQNSFEYDENKLASTKKETFALIDHFFSMMMINDLYIGEIFTYQNRYQKGTCIQDILKAWL